MALAGVLGLLLNVKNTRSENKVAATAIDKLI